MRRTANATFLLLAILASIVANTGCAGVTGASASPNSQTSTETTNTVSISILPNSVSLQAGATQQFTLSISGLPNNSVTWSATGGTITSSGLYTAPAAPGNYSVTATSTADPTKFVSAAVTVSSAPATISISISPNSVSLQTGSTQQFSATVTGTTNTTVTWSASAGTISPSGLYTSPAAAGTYTVTATSAADSTKSASTTITVTNPPPSVSVSINPTSASIPSGTTVVRHCGVHFCFRAVHPSDRARRLHDHSHQLRRSNEVSLCFDHSNCTGCGFA